MPISNPSTSVDEVNIPEVSDLKTEFTYYAYTRDERINPNGLIEVEDPFVKDQTRQKMVRSITLTWRPPSTNLSGINSESVSLGAPDIYGNKDKIISEDNFFNRNYINQTYSNVSAIVQGASDIENFSRLSSFDTESMVNMANFHVQKVADKSDIVSNLNESVFRLNSLASTSEAYSTLANFPASSLGLRVIDQNGGVSDKNDLIRSISKSLTLSVKINSSIVPDIFKEAATVDPNRSILQKAISTGNTPGLLNSVNSSVPAVRVLEAPSGNYGTVKIIGYVVDKYIYTGDKFISQGSQYFSGVDSTTYVDSLVLYGKTYFYSVRTIASLTMFLYNDRVPNSTPSLAEVWVSSKPTTTAIETFEETPPPPPNSLSFSFDYRKRNLVVSWEPPSDSQNDIKQYQVFRRSSLKHPFELIAQYGFDDSLVGDDSERYKTNETVDANNYSNMKSDLRRLVKLTDGPIYTHIDEDFTVDPEFYESSDYIYAICSVDAHGMISNYSSQHRVTFNSYKNALEISQIIDSGCPKQYPNLKLKSKVFKDVLSVSGDNTRQISIHFTPEYLKLKEGDRRSNTINVVKTQKQESDKKKSYYVLQFLNTDNQKVQSIKINIQDPRSRVS